MPGLRAIVIKFYNDVHPTVHLDYPTQEDIDKLLYDFGDAYSIHLDRIDSNEGIVYYIAYLKRTELEYSEALS